MPLGRPTKLTEATIKKAQQYIADCVDSYDENTKSWTVNLPKAEGLARKLGVRRDTLYEWAKKSQIFSDILEAINQEQVERLINYSLAGRYNATIAKLVLGKHGYKESSDITSGNEKITTFDDNQVNKIAERIAERKASDGGASSKEASN